LFFVVFFGLCFVPGLFCEWLFVHPINLDILINVPLFLRQERKKEKEKSKRKREYIIKELSLFE